MVWTWSRNGFSRCTVARCVALAVGRGNFEMVVNRLLRSTWVSRAPWLRPDEGVALPVAESRLGCDNRGALSDVDAMRDHAASGMLGTTQVVALAPSTQEAPEITAHALVRPDHLIDPFRAEREAVFVPQPKAELLWTPPFRPQLPGKSATNTTSQFAWLVPDLLRSGLCRVLRLLKAVAPLSCVPSQFPTDRPLAEPQGLADLGLGLARLSQCIYLTSIFVRDPTIRPHS